MSWKARLSTNLQEVRVFYSVNNLKHKGVVDWLNKGYPEFKQLNPRLPFLIREAVKAPAQLWVRYDYMEEVMIDIESRTPDEIDQQLAKLVNIGRTMDRSYESVPKDVDIVCGDDPEYRFN
eukprot:TRINITY_DN12080_c0_g1_i1.p1 TRINITY_DN12080_c0_g1~~TRINITY_DN12080_c0_g1_i1.p1  ORF type:complete len:121 (-),score=14.63 TRINITY_DN12080_c0_g1_i1:46-408(-)